MTGQEEIAKILEDNIHFSGQTGGFVVHGAIEKLLEREKATALGFAQLFKGRLQWVEMKERWYLLEGRQRKPGGWTDEDVYDIFLKGRDHDTEQKTV